MINKKKVVFIFLPALFLLFAGTVVVRHFLNGQRAGSAPRINVRAATELPFALRPVVAEALGRDDASYYIAQTATGYTARNAAHHYTTTFAADGVRISGNNIAFTLALADAAYKNPVVEKNKITYAREGMTEWFVNGPLGLEQGFTIAEKPARGPVSLVIGIAGSVIATIGEDKRGIAIASPSGKVIDYRGLVAYDANGRGLPSWFEQKGKQLAIRVDDAGAVYPIVIDPFAQEQKLTASDGVANDFLGYKVSMSSDGTRVIVGADGADIGLNSAQGAAYIFSRSGTTWSQEQKLTALDGAVDDSFGIGVSMSGDGTRVIIGADGEDGGGAGANSNQGYAYVFSRSGTTWSQEQKLTASDNATGDYFGFNVSMDSDGSRVIVGASSKASTVGAAYVFSRSGLLWSQEQKLTASDGATDDFFGYNVSISSDGTRVVVGSGGDDILANANQGSAYIFSRSGTTWSPEQKLTAADGATGDNFGTGTAIDSSGARVIIGAVNDDVGANADQGSAYVFSRSGTTWSPEQKLTAADGAASDFFGTGVSVSSDASKAVIGAGNDDVGANTNQGSAYIFSRSGTTWSQDQQLTAADNASEFFGYKVFMSSDGTRVIAGSYGADIGANTDQGAAYIFLSPTPIGSGGLSKFIQNLQGGVAKQYVARDTYTPNDLVLRAENCASAFCAITLQFSAPETAALDRFSLRNSENGLRIPYDAEQKEGNVTLTFPWPANSELPVRLCYAHTNNAEYCANARIWTPAAFAVNDVVVEQRHVDEKYAVDIHVPSFNNFSYLSAGKSSVLVDVRDASGAIILYERVAHPETRSLLLPQGRYGITLTPMNAAGDDGAPVVLPALELAPPAEPVIPPPPPTIIDEVKKAVIKEAESLRAPVNAIQKEQVIAAPKNRSVEPAPIIDFLPPRLAPIIEVGGGNATPSSNIEQLMNVLAPGNPLIAVLRNLINKSAPAATQ